MLRKRCYSQGQNFRRSIRIRLCSAIFDFLTLALGIFVFRCGVCVLACGKTRIHGPKLMEIVVTKRFACIFASRFSSGKERENWRIKKDDQIRWR